MADPQIDPEFAAQLAQLLQSSGAGNFMNFGGAGGGQDLAQLAALSKLFESQKKGPLFQPTPVGVPGPGNAGTLAPNYGPQGTIFLGGSPFKPDFGPARTQNTLALLQNLLQSSSQFKDSDMGQALGEKIKSLFGSK